MSAATVDLATQIYQAVITNLKHYPQLVAAIGTWQDPSQQTFQQFIQTYQAADTPALLVLPMKNLPSWGMDSQSGISGVFSVGVAISTDDQMIVPVNQAVGLLINALYANFTGTGPNYTPFQKNFGLSFVWRWKPNNGRMFMDGMQSELDKAAGGGKRWRAVIGIDFDYVLGGTDANNFAANYVIV